mmetsp:Transcript_14265/g.30892  ORF Transcript_14265/g.30892 Transcript_14265/m.30892 type:complete len:386 (+) Transcript_14265:490-1647(+)
MISVPSVVVVGCVAVHLVALKVAEHVLIAAEQVTYAQHEVEARLVLPVVVHHGRHQPLHGQALGHTHRPHLHTLTALDDFHRCVADGPGPQVLQQVSGLDAPKLHVCILVVPHQAGLPRLHKGARGALTEVVKHQLHTLHPLPANRVKHRQPLGPTPPWGGRGPHVHPVLCRQPYRHVVEELLQLVGFGAAEDHHHVGGVLAQLLYRGQHLGVDFSHGLDLVKVALGLPGGFHTGGERGVVAEHNDAACAADVALNHLLAVQRGRGVPHAQVRLDVRVVELRDEGVGPVLSGVGLHVHVVLPVPLPPLLFRHGQRVLDGLRHVRDVPGVDQDCPRTKGLSSTCKLTEHQHPRVVTLTRHVLVTDKVHAVTQAGHKRHIRDGVQGA